MFRKASHVNEVSISEGNDYDNKMTGTSLRITFVAFEGQLFAFCEARSHGEQFESCDIRPHKRTRQAESPRSDFTSC